MINLNNFIKAKKIKCMPNMKHSDLDKWNAIGKLCLTSIFQISFKFLVRIPEFTKN